MLVQTQWEAPVSLKMNFKAFKNPSLVGCPVPKTRYPGTYRTQYNLTWWPSSPLLACLKLGAPSYAGSLGSRRWMFSKWSYFSTQIFIGLLASLALAASFSLLWNLSLFIHSHLSHRIIRRFFYLSLFLPFLLQLYHDGLTGGGCHGVHLFCLSEKW